MEEALEFGEYLPFSIADSGEQSYLQFLWAAFESNYSEGRYEFASLAFHLLYMSFISFSIWQIRLARPEPFQMAMVGFQADHETALTGCDNAQVGEFAKFVKRRNKIAHPAGSVFFNDQRAIDEEIAAMMREVRNIETHMEPIISELYERFLIESGETEELEYGTLEQEINANLIHKNYMSAADLRHCGRFDTGTRRRLPASLSIGSAGSTFMTGTRMLTALSP